MIELIFDSTGYALEGYAIRLIEELGLDQYTCELVVVDTDEDIGEAGYCTGGPDYIMIALNTDAMTKEETMVTLAHEMVHAEQILRGDLELEFSGSMFRGQNVTDMDYREQPHEIEAYAREELIYNKCK